MNVGSIVLQVIFYCKSSQEYIYYIQHQRLCHAFNHPTLLFFQFTHFFNQTVIITFDDVFEIHEAVFNEQHVKQEPKQIPRRIH